MRLRPASSCALALLSAGALAAQQPAGGSPPAVPAGVPVVVLPVQSAVPDPGGTWVGGTGSARRTIDLLNAEIEFAFGADEGADRLPVYVVAWLFGFGSHRWPFRCRTRPGERLRLRVS